jgi:hypothetical protein
MRELKRSVPCVEGEMTGPCIPQSMTSRKDEIKRQRDIGNMSEIREPGINDAVSDWNQ